MRRKASLLVRLAVRRLWRMGRMRVSAKKPTEQRQSSKLSDALPSVIAFSGQAMQKLWSSASLSSLKEF